MKQLKGLLLLTLLLSTLPLVAVPLYAQDIENSTAEQPHKIAGSNDNQASTILGEISVKPARCVALRQGQNCFQKITLHWASPTEGEYCLHRESIETALICWRGTELDKYNYLFDGQESEVFYIAEKTSSKLISKGSIRVAWVYKNKKRVPTGWRLF